jgi:uncharacterized protein YndB with AHSA1/START domain
MHSNDTSTRWRTDVQDLGDLDRVDDGWRLTFRRRLAQPPEKVWRAVTEPEHLAAWFPDRVLGTFAPGAPLRFELESGDGFDGEMIEFDPPRSWTLRWGVDLVRVDVEPDGDGTVLTLTDVFTEQGKAARDAAGWHDRLAHLVAHLDGGDVADGDTWPGAHPHYVDALGPAAATIGPPGR